MCGLVKWVVALLGLCFVAASATVCPAGEPVVVSLWTDAELGITVAGDTEIRTDRPGNNASIRRVNRPTLTVYQAKTDNVSGAGVVVCPGGGYGGLAIEKEGHEVARWFASQGVTAGVLKYRCGGGPNQHPVPMQDARQAVKLMRDHAERWNVKVDMVGILGFSAGGHLASTIATDPETGLNFAALIYPVITMADEVTHRGSKRNLLGDSPSDGLVKQMSRDELVTADTCPTFLVHSGDDGAVPVANSLRYYAACVEKGVPAEMHLFPTGGHGFGMFRGDRPVDRWPNLLKAWMVSNGWCRADGSSNEN